MGITYENQVQCILYNIKNALSIHIFKITKVKSTNIIFGEIAHPLFYVIWRKYDK